MEIKSSLIFLFAIVGFVNAQKIKSESILGTWRFDKSCDLRTETEKSKYAEIPWCSIKTDNGTGYPDRTFKKNGEYTDYFSSQNVEYGKWEIKNGTLILTMRISKKATVFYKDRMSRLLKNGAISQGEDGFLYQNPIEIPIKLISKNELEFGTDKAYSIHKKIKQQ